MADPSFPPRDDAPRFPPPRTRVAEAPYRTAAPVPSAPPPLAAPSTTTRVVHRPDPPAPVEPSASRTARRPEPSFSAEPRASATPPSTTGQPLPDPVITDDDVRNEVILASIERTPGGRGIILGLILVHPMWLGAIALVAGIALTAEGIATHNLTSGPGAMATGITWMLCERVPLTKMRLRLVLVIAGLFGAIAVDSLLKALGVLAR